MQRKDNTIQNKAIESKGTTEIVQELAAEDELTEAIYRFNIHPSKGIYELCDFYGVSKTPEAMAHILLTTDGLIGEKIGDFLASDKTQPILLAYFRELDLKQLSFIVALRKSLSSTLRLPGEGEQIDMIVHGFAQVYCEMNPDVFNNLDIAYILAYALILLNSDQHMPNVPRRMNSRQFIENMRGAIKPEDISDSKLLSMYDDIKENPIEFGERSDGGSEFLALSAPKLHGYLKKKTNKWNSIWTTHFFVLANSCLYYFKSDDPENKDDPIGMIQLVSVKVSIADKRPNRIIISAIQDSDTDQYTPSDSYGLNIMPRSRSLSTPIPNSISSSSLNQTNSNLMPRNENDLCASTSINNTMETFIDDSMNIYFNSESQMINSNSYKNHLIENISNSTDNTSEKDSNNSLVKSDLNLDANGTQNDIKSETENESKLDSNEPQKDFKNENETKPDSNESQKDSTNQNESKPDYKLENNTNNETQTNTENESKTEYKLENDASNETQTNNESKVDSITFNEYKADQSGDSKNGNDSKVEFKNEPKVEKCSNAKNDDKFSKNESNSKNCKMYRNNRSKVPSLDISSEQNNDKDPHKHSYRRHSSKKFGHSSGLTPRYIQYVRFAHQKPEIVQGVSEIFLEATSPHVAQRWYYRIKHSIVCANFGGEHHEEMISSFSESAIGNSISETSDHTE